MVKANDFYKHHNYHHLCFLIGKQKKPYSIYKEQETLKCLGSFLTVKLTVFSMN